MTEIRESKPEKKIEEERRAEEETWELKGRECSAGKEIRVCIIRAHRIISVTSYIPLGTNACM